MNAAAAPESEFTITRELNAPLADVWDAWVNADSIAEWWGPQGFTGRVVRSDFREGGSTLTSMSNPDFGTMHNAWNYTRIVPNERIEFEMTFADAEGNAIEPPIPGVPLAVPHVVSFRDLGDGRTELSVTESGYTDEQAMQISRAGQEQVLDKLISAVDRRLIAR